MFPLRIWENPHPLISKLPFTFLISPSYFSHSTILFCFVYPNLLDGPPFLIPASYVSSFCSIDRQSLFFFLRQMEIRVDPFLFHLFIAATLLHFVFRLFKQVV